MSTSEQSTTPTRSHVVRRAHALLGLATALACTAPSPEPQQPIVFHAAPVGPAPEPPRAPPPGPSRVEIHYACDSLERPAGSLEVVPQRPLDIPPERFDPTGRYAASGSLAQGGCEVWELEGGVYLGRFGRPRSSGDCVKWPGNLDPCATWPELEQPDLQLPEPVDAQLTAGAIELVIESKLVRALRAGEERYRFVPDQDEYLGAWLSRDQSRLALLRDDAIELRVVETGALLGTLSLLDPAPPSHALDSLYLTWTPDGMPVTLLSWEACDEPEREWCRSSWEWELRTWARPGAVAKVKPVSAVGLSKDPSEPPAQVERVTVDPLGRWLFVHLSNGIQDEAPRIWQVSLSAAHAQVDVAPTSPP